MHYKSDYNLCCLAKDALRFVIEFREPIEQSASHVRYSALTLLPRSSPLYAHYVSHIRQHSVRMLYGTPTLWPGWNAVLDGHTDSAYAVAFSPNGRLIASGSEDSTIRLWDARTYAPVGDELQGHKGIVTAVVFEPDSKHILSCAEDRTIRRWNAASGDQVGKPFQGHDDSVTSLAVASNDTTMLAVISGS